MNESNFFKSGETDPQQADQAAVEKLYKEDRLTHLANEIKAGKYPHVRPAIISDLIQWGSISISEIADNPDKYLDVDIKSFVRHKKDDEALMADLLTARDLNFLDEALVKHFILLGLEKPVLSKLSSFNPEVQKMLVELSAKAQDLGGLKLQEVLEG